MATEETIAGATRITLLRHGEVDGRAHVFRGTLDDPLTPAGLARMKRSAENLAHPAFDRVASSPRMRCAAFAREYCAARALPLDVLPAFAEVDFGVWEGLTPDEASLRDPEAYRHYRLSGGREAPPCGESLDRFRRRVVTGWGDWLDDADGGHRLLVTHAGVMRVLLMELIGLPIDHLYRIALPEAANFTVSILPGSAPVLLGLNIGLPPCVD